jgi:hypothetical protein
MFSLSFWLCTVLYVFRVVHLRACVSPSDSSILYSFLSFRQVHLWYDLKLAGLTSWFLLSVGNKGWAGCSDLDAVFRPHGGIYLLHLKPTILSVCDTLIHLEELLQPGVLLCPISASIAITSQVELDPTRWARAAAASSSVRRVKSYLSSLNLVPFGNPRFRASISSSTSVSFYQQRSQLAKINANKQMGLCPSRGRRQTTRSPRPGTSSRQRLHRLRGFHRLRGTAT